MGKKITVLARLIAKNSVQDLLMTEWVENNGCSVNATPLF